MGFDWAEKFSEGRKIRQRVPILGYKVPLLSNLQVKIKGFSLAVKNVTNRNILCGNVPTVLVSIGYHMSGEMISVLSLRDDIIIVTSECNNLFITYLCLYQALNRQNTGTRLECIFH